MDFMVARNNSTALTNGIFQSIFATEQNLIYRNKGTQDAPS